MRRVESDALTVEERVEKLFRSHDAQVRDMRSLAGTSAYPEARARLILIEHQITDLMFVDEGAEEGGRGSNQNDQA